VRAGLTAAAARVPVVWDPHLRGAAPVEGTRLVTPNQSEAAALAGGAVDGAPLTALAGQIEQLRDRWSVHAVCATLGPRGALLTLGSGAPIAVPAPPVPGGDTCGAGDRFASAAAAALADGQMVSAAVQLAVEAASAYVGAGGAEAFHSPAAPGTSAPRDPWERIESIRARGGTVVATGGCFDLLHAGHIRLLRDARALGDCLVVCLNSDASVRRLKGPQRPLVPEADRARVLQALEPVDAVLVFEQDTPVEALRRLKPHVWAKGGDYALTDLPEAAEVARWGGQTVVLPYLDGRSTTSLIDAARNRVTS
jgi:D-beta-D-heptose 7-phosphate kinase/D-beta-D-heptose 1-phosphate adenosyltransferase